MGTKKKGTNKSDEGAELRRRAEEQVEEQKAQPTGYGTDTDKLRLIHELQVHQVELEMQNEELIQARKEVEAGLEQFTDLYDFAPVGYFTFDREGFIRQVNLAGAALLGVERSRLVGRRFGVFVSEADRPVFNGFLDKVFNGQAKETCEIVLPKEENQLFVRIEAAVSRDGQECRTAVMDITERKLAEEARYKSEQIYHALGESIDYGIWICDPDGRNTYASESFLKLVGMTQEQCSNFGWGNVLHPDDAERTIAAWKECVRTGGTWDIEHRYRGMDGQWHSILARGVPIRDEHGEITCWAGINLDISRLKQAEEVIRKYTQDLSERIKELKCLYLVSETVRKSGLSQEEVLQESANLVTQAYMYPEITACCITWGDREYKTENFRKTPWSQSRAVMVHGEEAGTIEVCYLKERPEEAEGPFLAEERNLLNAIADLLGSSTERKRAEEALRKAHAELELRVRERTVELKQTVLELQRSNQDLEQFAYVSSHDLQEPLRMVSVYCGLIAKNYADKLDPNGREFLEFAVEGAQRMQELILNLLQYSRVKTHAGDLKPIDCNAVLATTLRLLRLEIEETGAQITADPLPTVRADDKQLIQVFQNLISNALKFRRPEEPPKIHVSAQPTNGEWLFSIRDNGIGIEQQYFKKIFVIFQRLHLRRLYPGTGMGLAIVKKIIERHGGEVCLESKPGEGSIFYFTLPLTSPTP